MEGRAIGDLAQLSDEEFFKQVATGMDLVFENASAMESDAGRLIADERWRGAALLRAVAEEESAKYLILLDAVRCPRGSMGEKQVFARHLRSFYNHLAKGIYADYCHTYPVTFQEARRYIDSLRPELYLDGPEYSLWIFRNRILQKREELLYVDYVNTDEGRCWTTPARQAGLYWEPPLSAAFRLVSALHKLGISNSQALSVVSSIWRPTGITDDSDFGQMQELAKATLTALEQNTLLRADPEAISTVIDRWMFPLYPLDLGPLKADKSALREAQREEANRFYEQF